MFSIGMANVLTGIRILCGVLLFTVPVFSKGWYLFFLLAGFTDAIDGTVARKCGLESAFGAKFDTTADFIFFAAGIIRIIGAVALPKWMLVWVGLLFILKVWNGVFGIKKHGRFVPVHSTLNRVCGIVTYATLLAIGYPVARLLLTAVCLLATAAAVQERIIIQKESEGR